MNATAAVVSYFLAINTNVTVSKKNFSAPQTLLNIGGHRR